MRCQNVEKGEDATKGIQTVVPPAWIEALLLDSMDLESVVAAAGVIKSKAELIHRLMNSAGMMGTPCMISSDAYESHF